MSRDVMQALARSIDIILNGQKPGEQTTGFVLLTFPLNEPNRTNTNYASNATRADMIVGLKEIVARLEGQPDVRGRA